MRATTRAALIAGPALFLAGGIVASHAIGAAPCCAALAAAQPVELAPAGTRTATFAILIVTIALAALASALVVRDAPAVPRALLALSAGGSAAAAFAWPLVFSADVHAYAAYGLQVLHGVNPYAAAVRAPGADPALRAHVAAWSGSIPRDVYGPAFTALAAVAALAAEPIAVLRVVAIASYAGCVLAWRRGDARGAARFATHPVVAWAAIEGHNDALALFPVLLAFDRLRRGRIALTVLGAAIKAFALLPLAYAVLAPRLRTPGAASAIVLLVWVLVPHPYAWYAVWLTAAAWHAPPSPARTGLLAAAYCGLASYLPEVRFGPHPATFRDDPAFLGSLLMMQYAAPLVAVLIAAAALRPSAVLAQAGPPPSPPPLASPLPAAAPLPASPAPVPAAPVTAAPGATGPTPAPSAAPGPASPPSPGAPPVPAATPAPGPSPFAYVIVPPPPAAGSPAITEISLPGKVLHSGGPFALRVATSPDVASVVLEAYGQRLALYLDGPGRFSLAGTVPNAPSFYLNRTYTITAVAATADGRQTSVPVAIRLER